LAFATLLGFVASVLVLWRVLAPPPEAAGRPALALLGLVACVGLTAGSFLSMRNDRPRAARPAGVGADAPAPEPIRIADRGAER
jgi:hypothetical protein